MGDLLTCESGLFAVLSGKRRRFLLDSYFFVGWLALDWIFLLTRRNSVLVARTYSLRDWTLCTHIDVAALDYGLS